MPHCKKNNRITYEFIVVVTAVYNCILERWTFETKERKNTINIYKSNISNTTQNKFDRI